MPLDPDNGTRWILNESNVCDKYHLTETDEEGVCYWDGYLGTADCTRLELNVAEAFTREGPGTIRVANAAAGREARDGATLLPDKRSLQIIRKYVIRRGETARIPRVHRGAIQQTQCKHESCITRPFACRNPAHVDYQLIVGGLAPHLERISEEAAPALHPMLREAGPALPAQPLTAETLNPPKPTSADERALERARAKRAGGAA